MKVSGFTFIRNALVYDYPVTESIRSILPLCDEMVVAVGQSEDDTLGLIRSIDSDKIRILETTWEDFSTVGSAVLAMETDKAFRAISADADWAFYIQADEILHEQYQASVRAAMAQYKDDKSVQGLLFDFFHFYGSYNHVGVSNKWYKKEIRIIRNDPSIYSYRDAQGFRRGHDEKLFVRPVDAAMYHYGWVREPHAMQRKLSTYGKRWEGGDPGAERRMGVEAFEYEKHITRLARFEGTHPAVMKERIERLNWTFESDISFRKISLKDHAKNILAAIGIDTNFMNYRLMK